jgi:hypothetical protein
MSGLSGVVDNEEGTAVDGWEWAHEAMMITAKSPGVTTRNKEHLAIPVRDAGFVPWFDWPS